MKKPLALFLSLVLSLSLAVPAFAEGDTPWYAEAQQYVTEKGIMTGTDKGFEPMGVTTRAQVFQTIYNMEGAPAASSDALFPDAVGKWYALSAAWALQAGVTTGDNGLYYGDRSITRAELVTILYRYAKDVKKLDVSVGEDTNILSYDDAFNLPEWSVAAFQWACGAGVINGKGTALAPSDSATRAELAAVLMRFDKLIESQKIVGELISIDVPAVDDIPAHSVPAIVTLPEGEGPFPAVVMLHGTGSNKNEAGGGYDLAAPAMAEAGIATIRIDFMGNGDSTASYKDYNYTSANIDAKAAADYMAKLDVVDANKLAVMGWSQGGTNALLAAAAYPGTFKAVVTWAGALDLTTMFDNFDAAYETAKTTGSYEMTFDWRDSLPVGERWFKEVKETDVLKAIEGLKAPVLSIHGDKDDTVPFADSENVQKTLGTNNLCTIEGADHTYNIFVEEDGATIMKAIRAGISFLQQTLNGAVTGRVIEVEKYGHAKLDTTILGFTAAGYALGDVVTVKGGTYAGDMPYFDGYYVDNGDYMLRAYPGHENIAVCINYGKFAETAGLNIGDTVTISLKEKAGALTTQQINNLVYTDKRADYDSDAVFANFREVNTTGIGAGKLYRSSSPVNNEHNRAAVANKLVEAAGVKSVMNLADTEEEYAAYVAADTFSSMYYKGLYDAGNVIVLGMPVNFSSDEFAEGIVKGLTFLSEHEGPYLVHCNEGKDRAGFTAMLLEALMGASQDEIVADYMLSYVNYYHIDPQADAAKYQMLAEKNVMEMLRTVVGVEKGASLADVDLANAAETYLTAHGMTDTAIAALKANLK
ncbi:MAG: alpha/beta fold hydrolase [Ruminococcaceae bacterium]|nr:alpha/beta fold hydrolase [Oscillospiraceae bacterium]